MLLLLKVADQEVRHCNTFGNVFPVIKDVAAGSVTAKRVFFLERVNSFSSILQCTVSQKLTIMLSRCILISLDLSGYCFLLSAFFVFFYCSYVFTTHQFGYLCVLTSQRASNIVCLMGKVHSLGEQLLHVPHLGFRDG